MPPAQPVRARLYKDLLVPVLHKRFFNFPDSILTLTAVFCYVAAFLMGNHGSYSWMIISTAGRAFILYTPAFLIIMVRLTQMQFAKKSTTSGLETLLHMSQQKEAYQIIAAYLISGWLFSEVYIMTAGEEAGLGWVTEGQIYEKLKLNENVIYLRSHAFIVASVQALIHLYHDYSVNRLPPPRSLLKIKEKRQKPESDDARKGTMELMREQALPLALSCVARAIAFLVLGPFLYFPIRPLAWNAALSFARNFMRWNIPEYSQYDVIPPFHYTILWRTFLQALMLFSIWEASNAVFTIYISQEPIKNGYPLTDDYKKPKPDEATDTKAPVKQNRKDPNGSLLTGLKAKNQKANFFSMWELDIIVRRFETRRKSILTELDRKDGSACTQALNVCLGLVDGVVERINPKKFPTVDATKEVQRLPKIAPPPVQDKRIESPAKASSFTEDAVIKLGNLGRSIGSGPPGSQFMFAPHAKKYLETAEKTLLTEEQRNALTKEQMASTFRKYAVWLLRQELWLPKSPISGKFQVFQFLHCTYARQLNARVFGSPTSDFFLVVRAVDVVSALVAASVTEDTYGEISKSLPQIWRSFVRAVKTIQGLKQQIVPHWTDVNFNAETKKDKEVEQLLNHLREGIQILLLNFGDVAGELGLTPADVEGARKAVTS